MRSRKDTSKLFLSKLREILPSRLLIHERVLYDIMKAIYGTWHIPDLGQQNLTRVWPAVAMRQCEKKASCGKTSTNLAYVHYATRKSGAHKKKTQSPATCKNPWRHTVRTYRGEYLIPGISFYSQATLPITARYQNQTYRSTICTRRRSIWTHSLSLTRYISLRRDGIFLTTKKASPIQINWTLKPAHQVCYDTIRYDMHEYSKEFQEGSHFRLSSSLAFVIHNRAVQNQVPGTYYSRTKPNR